MRNELGVRLASLYGGDGSTSKAVCAMAKAGFDAKNPRVTKIEIVSPSKETFQDFGKDTDGRLEIPNEHLLS